jgi:hypothetical protein
MASVGVDADEVLSVSGLTYQWLVHRGCHVDSVFCTIPVYNRRLVFGGAGTATVTVT